MYGDGLGFSGTYVSDVSGWAALGSVVSAGTGIVVVCRGDGSAAGLAWSDAGASTGAVFGATRLVWRGCGDIDGSGCVGSSIAVVEREGEDGTSNGETDGTDAPVSEADGGSSAISGRNGCSSTAVADAVGSVADSSAANA